MTVIYRCDRCGKEHECPDGIVNHMHKQYGFEELRAKIDGARDVCKVCYKKIVRATLEAKKEDRKSVMARTLEILRST